MTVTSVDQVMLAVCMRVRVMPVRLVPNMPAPEEPTPGCGIGRGDDWGTNSLVRYFVSTVVLVKASTSKVLVNTSTSHKLVLVVIANTS